MNRPFYAFGALMAFLALAMLAIGLSSRPTGRRPSAGGSQILAPQRTVSPTAYVLILPAEASSPDLIAQVSNEFPCDVPVEQPSYAQGCGLDRNTGEVYAKSRDAASGLRSVTIRAAADPSALAAANDLATGYDAAYDRAMAIERPFETAAARRSAVIGDDEQLVALFRSLSPKAPTSIRVRRLFYELRTFYLGTLNRLAMLLADARLEGNLRAAARMVGLAASSDVSRGPRPTWAEYEAWIGSKQWSVAGRHTPAGGRAFWSQPSDKVLQIAVSALNRVAEMLHDAIARVMDRAAPGIARLPGGATRAPIAK